MEQLAGRVAVVTGGGSGIGRELVRQLAAAGCHVATCDVDQEHLAETADSVAEAAPDATVSTFVADVADEHQLLAFRDHVCEAHRTDRLHLLFNNAGIGGAGSFVQADRQEWEKVFAVCWGGVYLGTRTFLPLLLAAEEGHIVNTSSVNGFWATLLGQPHTAYSTAKFAVKGFTEALIDDFRVHAPHVRVSVVMPGHIGTSILGNSMSYLGRRVEDLTRDELCQHLTVLGVDPSSGSDEELRALVAGGSDAYRDSAPVSAAQAATIILDGVRANEWRILVGEDARLLDEAVRADPVRAYEPSHLTGVFKDGRLLDVDAIAGTER